jgi:ferredoxin-NADP reductase
MHARYIRTVWENEAHTIGTFYFKPDKPFYFTAGQYTSLTIPHDNPDRRGLTRTMTVSSSPSSPTIGFTTRFSPHNNNRTYKKALLALKPGDAAAITNPMGDLVLPLDDSVPLIFVAGGLGIASYISMMHWLVEQKDVRDVTLLYAVRSTDDIIFQDIFDAYSSIGRSIRVLYTTDHKIAEYPWNGIVKKARLTSKEIMQYVQPTSQIYISGAEHMVEQLYHELLDMYKIPQYRIAFDYFEGYTDL